MALSKDRATPTRKGLDVNDPVAAGMLIFAGSIVMLNAAGNAVKGATNSNLTPRGVAQEYVDNTNGIDGAQTITVRKGCFRFKNDASVSRADIGSTAYVVDDETVANTDGGSTRSALGLIIDVDAQGVWVEIV